MIVEPVFAGYASMFLVAFLAATVFPAQSELLLSALLVAEHFDPALLLFVATAGNVLGSCSNWIVGRFLSDYRDRRWFPVSDSAFETAERWFARFGPAVLLLSWVPVVGDPLTVVAGVLRMRLLPFLLIVTVAKAGRYGVLAAAVTGWSA